MPKGELSTTRVGGIGEGSLVGALSKLLQLTCEAVLVFDGSGRVLLANDEAAELLGFGEGLVGVDVRALVECEGVAEAPFDVRALGIPVDGSVGLATLRSADGRAHAVRVRCDAVRAPGETYLLVALPVNADALAEREGARAMADLRRANHRLSGTLNIVLDTIDSADIATLFERTLEELTDTMEADGTLVYLSEADGFHLRGISSGLLGERLARVHALRAQRGAARHPRGAGGAPAGVRAHQRLAAPGQAHEA